MELLFSKGKSSTVYPIKAVYLETPVNLIFPAQAMFVAPKRNFKKAHDRNKIKRRMKEVYRLNKLTLYQQLELTKKKLNLAFIYIGKKQEEYSSIEQSILKLLSGITKEK